MLLKGKVADFVTHKNYVRNIKKKKQKRGNHFKGSKRAQKGDQSYRGIWRVSCSETYKQMICEARSSRRAWRFLENHFKEIDPENQGDLLQEFFKSATIGFRPELVKRVLDEQQRENKPKPGSPYKSLEDNVEAFLGFLTTLPGQGQANRV